MFGTYDLLFGMIDCSGLALAHLILVCFYGLYRAPWWFSVVLDFVGGFLRSVPQSLLIIASDFHVSISGRAKRVCMYIC